MPDIVRLIDDHDALDKLADQLIAAARPGHAEPAACRALMNELAARLEAHLRDEADFLYEDAIGAVPSMFGEELRRFEESFAALQAGWDLYLDHWTAARITSNRATYAGDTADMLTALKLRIARENQLLYPLALETGRISFN